MSGELNLPQTSVKYPWMKWVIPLCLYFILKLLVNFEPVLYVDDKGFHTGLFNFYKKNVPENAGISSGFLPALYISPGAVHTGAGQRLPPFSRVDNSIYLMGTDHLGRDVLAGWISGLEVALLTGLGAGFIIYFIILGSGAISAYYKRFPVKLKKWAAVIWYVLLLSVLLFTGWFMMGILAFMPWLLLVMLFTLITFYMIQFLSEVNSGITLPFSKINKWLVQFLQPVPDLILLMVFSLLFPGMGIAGLVIIIVILRWPFGALFLEGRATQLMSREYISQSHSMGFSAPRIICRHLIPQMASAAFILSIQTALRAIVAESALSLLGLGPTANYITWGSMIRLGLEDFSMWWVSFFPIAGLIILSIYLYSFIPKWEKNG